MSALTELPVPTTFDNGVQSIINICVAEMEPTNRQTGIDNNNNNHRTVKQQAWTKGKVMVHHIEF